MRNKIVILFALVGLLMLGPGSAGANLITFDHMALGNIDGQHIQEVNGGTLGPVTTQNGVTITSSDGSAAVMLGNATNYGFVSVPNVVSNNSFITSASLTFTFDIGRGYVALDAGDSGGDVDNFKYTAYDVYGNVLVSGWSGVFGGNPEDSANRMVDKFHLSLLDIGYIKTLVISDAINFGILIDNLEYCHPVPIPGAAYLLGSGLLGLLGLRRRKSVA